MNKTNSFVKYLKHINKSINNQLEKNLNRLKFDNLVNLAVNNKIILTFVAFIILFISYLLLPTFYKQSQISKELKSGLLEKFDLDIKFSKNFNYNLFPRPHFKVNDSSILFGKDKVSNVKKIKIYISLENLFSIENIEIKDVIIENANFSFKKDDFKFFIKLLENNLINSTLYIKDSNIFFRSFENEVLVINKINDMKYYYDQKELKNILHSNNEIFNVPYQIKIFNDINKKILFSEVGISIIKFKFENELLYANEVYHGKTNLVYNKLKSIFTFKTNKNFFEFNFLDKLENPKFEYSGIFNFKPFHSYIKGNTKKLNLSYLLGENSIISQLIKTEIFNNNNVDFKLNIDAENIHNNLNFKNIIFNSKIQEGLIDIDQTKLAWKDSVEFNFDDSLIFVKEGELVLDGNLSIIINDYDEIYKFLLTPKNYRNEIKKVNLNFTYNFDQRTANLKDIRINDKLDLKLNRILGNIVFKQDNLQNKIYLKKILNQAIKNYEG